MCFSFSTACFFLHILLSILLCLILPPSSHCFTKAAISTTTSVKSRRPPRPLSMDYYSKSCPQVDQLVGNVTLKQFQDKPVSAPATIRLFFQDCFVDGCDGSILITSKPGSNDIAEKDAEDNRELAMEASESINMAKERVEGKCPGVVSCADILAIAARDFVHLTGGPYYQVKKGRWDGKISKASRVPLNIPHANSTLVDILKLFNSKGLRLEDLVVLSGAHTIGFSHCKQFVGRLYNYKGTKQPDPSIHPRLLKALRMTCPPFGGNADVVVPFDVTTTFSFDNAYYGNLESNMGLLRSDQELYLDPRTRPLVQALSKDKQRFFQAFAAAMEKMGSIGIKRGAKHGEKRKICSLHV